MKQYHFLHDTPLAFHKFFRYFTLPIGLLVTIGRLFMLFSDIPYFNWFYLIDIGYYVVSIALIISCFIGFASWKPYAWYSVMIYLAITPLYCIVVIMIYTAYLPDEVASIVGQLIASVIYAILVGIYYIKRKLLFFNSLNLRMTAGSNDSQFDENSDTKSENSLTLSDMPAIQQQMVLAPQTKFCRKCGAELPTGDSQFCRMCGTRVILPHASDN